jgi:hypothetical protein
LRGSSQRPASSIDIVDKDDASSGRHRRQDVELAATIRTAFLYSRHSQEMLAGQFGNLVPELITEIVLPTGYRGDRDGAGIQWMPANDDGKPLGNGIDSGDRPLVLAALNELTPTSGLELLALPASRRSSRKMEIQRDRGAFAPRRSRIRTHQHDMI